MKQLTILILFIFCTFAAFSNQKNTPTNFNLNYNIDSYGVNPSVSTEEIKNRLSALPTEMEMHYTKDVQAYIDQYMQKGRKKITSLIVKSAYYLPIFEKALREAGLPEELKYLPIIESGLDPEATSRMGAAGLWQFMTATAKGYDMTVSSTIDERRDPYISSVKACEMLKKQYEKFGDWNLVLAAYNAGPGRVQKAISRANSGGLQPTFWEICKYLPAETQKYVPKFIAINYVMNYYEDHNVPDVTITDPFTTDTVMIFKKTSIKEVASNMNIPVEDLKMLNPHFRTDIIPGSDNKPCNLILPTAFAKEYKIKLGRRIDVQAGAGEKRSQPQKLSQNKTTKKTDKSSGGMASNKTPKRDNWDDELYENVPSKSMPGVYVRVRRAGKKPGNTQRAKDSIERNQLVY